MTQPEDKVRENIDRMLTKSGWAVRDQEESDNLADPDVLAHEIVVPRLASLGTPSSPEPQAKGTPSQDPRPARGPRRGVEDLEATLEQVREIAMDLGGQRI